jgi:predicted Fe-Mo cluster-binding NifX family protein
MKIIAVTENGSTLSNHFGQAPYFMVYTLQIKRLLLKRANLIMVKLRDSHTHQHTYMLYVCSNR